VESRYSDSAELLMRISGVGKRPAPLNSLEWLHLMHCRLNHSSSRKLVATLSSGILVVSGLKVTAPAVAAFNKSHCSVCNSYKQRKVSPHEQSARPSGDRKISINRALRPLHRIVMDVKGPIPVPSAQHGYRFLIGWTCEHTGMRWTQGVKQHTAAVQELHTQKLRAALRLTHPHFQFEIVRADNAPEYHADSWEQYAADSSFSMEYIVAYESRMLGAMERAWGINEPQAGALLNHGPEPAGKGAWYTAMRHSFYCANLISSEVVTLDKTTETSSAYTRFYNRPAYGDHLHVYGAKVWYVLDDTMRDGAFSAAAETGKYVGVSPENHRALLVWTGSRHVTVGGCHVIDETHWLSGVDTDAAIDEPAPAVVVANPTQPTPAPRKVKAMPAPQMTLPAKTVLRVKWLTGDDLTWYACAVVGHHENPSGKLLHEVQWLDSRWDEKEKRKWQFLDLSRDKPEWQIIGNSTSDVPPAVKAVDLNELRESVPSV
jgi:hypothetical protein